MRGQIRPPGKHHAWACILVWSLIRTLAVTVWVVSVSRPSSLGLHGGSLQVQFTQSTLIDPKRGNFVVEVPRYFPALVQRVDGVFAVAAPINVRTEVNLICVRVVISALC